MANIIFISFLSLIAVSGSALAKDKNGFQVLDTKQFEGLNTNGKSSVKFATTCKSNQGVEYRQGDTGYEACLRQSETDISNGKKEGASPAAEVSFGK